VLCAPQPHNLQNPAVRAVISRLGASGVLASTCDYPKPTEVAEILVEKGVCGWFVREMPQSLVGQDVTAKDFCAPILCPTQARGTNLVRLAQYPFEIVDRGVARVDAHDPADPMGLFGEAA
jgi:hypothetical protein